MRKSIKLLSLIFLFCILGTQVIEAADSTIVAGEKEQLVITNEQELINAIDNAQSTAELVIKGDSKINLTKTLVVNTDKVQQLSFKSSDNGAVELINANSLKHLNITGTKNIILSFNNVSLNGDGVVTDGGIEFSNTSGENEIHGLIAQNNHINKSISGVITFKKDNNSLLIKDSKFNNNKIVGTGMEISIVSFDGVNSDLSMTNVEFDANESNNVDGTALRIHNDSGKVVLDNLKLTNNFSESRSMRAIKYYAYKTGTLSLTNSLFKKNINNSGTGSAFHANLKNQTTLSISNSNFYDNFAYRGGAAYDVSYEGSPVATLDKVEMLRNKASMIEYDPNTGVQTGLPSSGGALGIRQSSGESTTTITNSALNNNVAGSGGAISVIAYTSAQPKLTVNDSILNNNKAEYMGGAVDFSYGPAINLKGLFTFNNSEIKNNVVTGDDTGPGYYQGGYGGGIAFDDLLDSPDVLVLNNINFDNNVSKFAYAWNYNESFDDSMSKMYKDNVMGTTYSKPVNAHLSSYNNSYNGDDVYTGHTGIAYFYANPDNLADLNVKNYPSDSDYVYNYSIVNSKILMPIQPESDNYEFIGWVDENGNAWDFNMNKQTEVHQRLYANWKKAEKFEVEFNLSDAPLEQNSNITPKVEVAKGSKLTNPGNAQWNNIADFTGWYIKDDSGFVKKWDFANDVVTEDTVLYAYWQVKVNFLIDGKTSENYPMLVLALGDKLNLSANDTITKSSTKSAATNIEWYVDSSYTTKADFSKPILKHTTLYGKTVTETDNNSDTNTNNTSNDKADISKTGVNNSHLIIILIAVLGLGITRYFYRDVKSN